MVLRIKNIIMVVMLTCSDDAIRDNNEDEVALDAAACDALDTEEDGVDDGDETTMMMLLLIMMMMSVLPTIVLATAMPCWIFGCHSFSAV